MFILIVSIRSADGVATHYKMLQARIIAFFHNDKINDMKLMRKQLKKKVRTKVNTLGPQLFKNFDKLKLIMREGSRNNSYYGGS